MQNAVNTFNISDEPEIDAIFQINAAGTTWGSIDGNIDNQTDLKNALDTLSGQIDSNHSEITTISATLQTYGDIVTHNTTEFATATQGTLADTALQPNDNITELNNNAGYITGIDSTDVTTALGYTPVNPANLATVATTGSYTDLSNTPTIGDGATTILVNSTAVGTITANTTSAQTVSIHVPTTATEVGALPSTTTINDLTTQAQQSAIDSGITTSLVSQIATNTSAISVNTSAIATNTSVINTLTTGKQDVLTAGANIQINGNTISATDTTYSAGENITITNGTISASSSGYTLPTASTSILGGVKVGNNLSISSDGTLDAIDTTYSAGNNITITNGTISATDTIYTLPVATTSVLGGVKIGNNLSIGAEGTLDAVDTTYSQGNGIVISGGTISTSTTIASKTDIGNADLTIQRNGTAIGTFSANATSASTVNISVPTTATDVGALPDTTTIGDGQIIFEKNSTPIATISANQTTTTTIDFTIPTTASDVGAQAVLTSANAGNNIQISSELPNGFQQLTYVGFTGTQVLDTNYIGNQDTKIVTHFKGTATTACWLYGTGSTNPRITAYLVSSGNQRFGNTTADNTGITYDAEFTLTQDKNGFYYAGGGKAYSDVGTFTCLNTLTIGNANGSTGTPYFKGELYSMKIYDNGDLVRDYVPAKRVSDDVIGLYDKVTYTFLTDSGLTGGEVVNTTLISFTNDTGYITGINSADVTNALGYTPVNSASLATVATTGSYADLTNTPTIGSANTTVLVNSTAVGTINANNTTADSISISVPTNTNQLTNGAGFIDSSALNPYQLIAQSMTSLSASGTIALTDNTVNKITATGAVTFTLPTVTDLTKFHQIFVQLGMSSAQTIDLGTTYYFNSTAPDLSAAGTYNLYFEYDNDAGHWVVGCIPKGAAS